MWAVVAAGAVVAATACDGARTQPGGSAAPRAAASETSGPSKSPSPSPSRAPTAAPVSAAEAAAAAAKINLTGSDVPGFATSPAVEPDAASDRAFDDYVDCLGGFKPVHDVSSDDFSSGPLQLSSNVSVFADEQTVREDLAALAEDKALGCTANYITAATGSPAGAPEPDVTRLSPSAPGADGTYGFSVKQSDALFQVLGFARGRTEVSLILIAADGDVDEKQRNRLFALLVQRGVANAL